MCVADALGQDMHTTAMIALSKENDQVLQK